MTSSCIINVLCYLTCVWFFFFFCFWSCVQPMLLSPGGFEPFFLELWGPTGEYKSVCECKKRRAERWGGVFRGVRGGRASSPSRVSVCSRLLRQLLSGEFPISAFLLLLVLLSFSFICFSFDLQVSSGSVGGENWAQPWVSVLLLRRIPGQTTAWPGFWEGGWMRLGTNTSAGTVPGFKDNSFFKHVNTYGYNKKSLLRVCALFLQSTMTNGDSSQHRQPCLHIHSQTQWGTTSVGV